MLGALFLFFRVFIAPSSQTEWIWSITVADNPFTQESAAFRGSVRGFCSTLIYNYYYNELYNNFSIVSFHFFSTYTSRINR